MESSIRLEDGGGKPNLQNEVYNWHTFAFPDFRAFVIRSLTNQNEKLLNIQAALRKAADRAPVSLRSGDGASDEALEGLPCSARVDFDEWDKKLARKKFALEVVQARFLTFQCHWVGDEYLSRIGDIPAQFWCIAWYYQSKRYCLLLFVQEGSALWGDTLATTLLHDQKRTISFWTDSTLGLIKVEEPSNIWPGYNRRIFWFFFKLHTAFQHEQKYQIWLGEVNYHQYLFQLVKWWKNPVYLLLVCQMLVVFLRHWQGNISGYRVSDLAENLLMQSKGLEVC